VRALCEKADPATRVRASVPATVPVENISLWLSPKFS
jgi:hypothetical protein